jgi:peptide/nickel transport system permease protein
MKEYLIKRLLMVIPTVLGITVVVFMAIHMIPGDPIDLLLAEDYSEEARQQLMREYGLDQPLYIQYVKWLWRVVQGNWGRSILTDRPVLPDVFMKLPVSLELIVVSMLISILIAIPAGIISATKPYSMRDYAAMTTALIGNSIPDFYIGILLILLFSHALGLLPVNGFVNLSDGLWDNLRHILLPAAALGFARAAILTRLVRASMLEVLKLDYVTTARAKGVRERWVVLKHALQNALIPTVTVIGLQIGFIIGGAIVVETLFTVPGLGQFGINAISGRDYPQVQAFILVTALVFVFSNLAVDILYAVLDPRISYEKKAAP